MTPPFWMRFDFWLIFKVFMPVAHEIDRRFHINHYRQAAQILMFSCFLVIISNGFAIMGDGIFIKAILISCAGLICFFRYLDIEKLTKLSNTLERDPSKIPYAAMYFIMPWNRLFHLIFGLLLMVADTIVLFLPSKEHHSLFFEAGRYISQSWFLIVSLGYYFAAIPPSPHKRVEKKVSQGIFGLTPALIRGKQ